MDRLWGALIVAVVLAAALTGMGIGWRRRRARQSGLDLASPVPAETGELLAAVEGIHVATTRAGDPLDRIAVGGLGFRARALVEVREHGILLALAGAPDRWIAHDDLRGADRATWTIDRTVEPDGLALVAWTLAGDDVDTYLRVDEPAVLVAAIDRLGTAGAAADRENA